MKILNQYAVHLKLIQLCESIMFQFKYINKRAKHRQNILTIYLKKVKHFKKSLLILIASMKLKDVYSLEGKL